MALSVRNMIAIVITIVVLLGVFFTVVLYYPANKLAKRTARNRALLEAQVESGSHSPAKEGQPKINVASSMAVVNYFKRRNLSPKEGIPELLKDINQLASQMSIRFIAVKPLEEVDEPGYRQYPFLIEIRAGYPEIVRFVHEVETDLHLSLDGLHIEADLKSPSTHNLRFSLNIFELKDNIPVDQEKIAEKPVGFSPPDESVVTVQRDPFGEKREIQVSKPLAQKSEAKTVSASRPESPKLVLMGVMIIAGKKVAIINDRILRPGETIQKQRVSRIENDRVIMIGGDKPYTIYRLGALPQEKREEIR